MALGKHLIQAVPFVYALQCPTGKVDNNKNNKKGAMHPHIISIHLLLNYPRVDPGGGSY